MAPRRGWGKGRGIIDPLARDSQVQVDSRRFLNRKPSEEAKCLCLQVPGALSAARESSLLLHYVAERNNVFHARYSSNKNIGHRRQGEKGSSASRRASLCEASGIFNFTSLRTSEITFDQREYSTLPSALSMPQIVFVKEMCVGDHQNAYARLVS